MSSTIYIPSIIPFYLLQVSARIIIFYVMFCVISVSVQDHKTAFRVLGFWLQEMGFTNGQRSNGCCGIQEKNRHL
jgi:hypothetical protein